MFFLLFILGAAVGSFLGVVAFRYESDKFLFGRQILGRSRCVSCGHKLRWFELVPIISFIFQFGRCRRCGARIGFRHLVVEIISGLIFVFVPLALSHGFFGFSHLAQYILLSVLWTFVFSILFLVALIDLRLNIIPDEANVALFAAGAAIAYLTRNLAIFERSFLGPYAMIFDFGGGALANHFFGAFAGGLIFGAVIFLTRGRGMGMGDLKLAVPLGMVFGWPDILVLIGISFVVGAIAGVYVIFFRHKTLKSAIPFAPFLVIGSAIVFFFGRDIADFYFSLFRG